MIVKSFFDIFNGIKVSKITLGNQSSTTEIHGLSILSHQMALPTGNGHMNRKWAFIVSSLMDTLTGSRAFTASVLTSFRNTIAKTKFAHPLVEY